MTIWSWVVFIGAILVAVGTLVKEKKRYEEEIRQKDDLINELQNMITGEDSYIFIRPEKVSNTNDVLFLIDFRGKYPLYDVSVLYEKFEILPRSDGKYEYKRTDQKHIQLGTVTPLHQLKAFEVTLPNESVKQFGQRYFFRISARNILIEEDAYIRREGGTHFTKAYKVYTTMPDYSGKAYGFGHGESHARVRHIDPAFPVHELDHLKGDAGWTAKYEHESGTSIVLPTSPQNKPKGPTSKPEDKK